MYINARLIFLHLSLKKDIYNYKDINLVFFANSGSIYFILNIYLDDH